jgi:hypothetical protein
MRRNENAQNLHIRFGGEMTRVGTLTLLIAAATFAALPLLSQTFPPPKLSFDVISIKPAAPLTERVIGGGTRGDRYTMRYATLRMLLQSVYQRPSTTPVAPLKVVGGPAWIDDDRYDIQATANCGGGTLSREQVQLMVQSMLEDRFQLKAHMETREGQVYNLVVAKNPPKIKVSEDQTPIARRVGTPLLPCSPVPEPPANPAPPPIGPGQRGNPFDQTGLERRFDFSVEFTREPTNPAPDAYYEAIQDQLGLELKATKVLLDTLVIDSVERPTEN